MALTPWFDCPSRLWHVDLTTVPTAVGFWVAWIPFALPRVWPFCWWMGVAIDQFSLLFREGD